jgi:hypothetical protein
VDKLDIDRGNTGETRRVRSQKLYLDNEHYRELYMEFKATGLPLTGID